MTRKRKELKKLIVLVLLGISIMATKATTLTGNLIAWECPHCGAKVFKL